MMTKEDYQQLMNRGSGSQGNGKWTQQEIDAWNAKKNGTGTGTATISGKLPWETSGSSAWNIPYTPPAFMGPLAPQPAPSPAPAPPPTPQQPPAGGGGGGGSGGLGGGLGGLFDWLQNLNLPGQSGQQQQSQPFGLGPPNLGNLQQLLGGMGSMGGNSGGKWWR